MCAAQSVHPLQSLQSAAVMGSRTTTLQCGADEKQEVKTYLERKTILNEIVCIQCLFILHLRIILTEAAHCIPLATNSTHTGHNIARVVAYITGSQNYVVKRKRSALAKYDIAVKSH